MSEEQAWQQVTETWAILDLMGHLRLAGKLTEQTIAGSAFLRIDIPAVEDEEPVTQYYSAAAVYSISPCTEELARALAGRCRPQPISQWDLPAEFRPKQIAGPVDDLEDPDDMPFE